MAKYVVDSYFESGELKELVETEPENFKAYIKKVGKELGIKGKNLPARGIA